MILADENINPQIITTLRESGFDVLSVREKFPGIDDTSVIELSKVPPRIILTEDKDFGEWVFAHGERDISVIFLRYRHPDLQSIIDTLVRLLRTKGQQLFKTFTTITEQKIRIRDL